MVLRVGSGAGLEGEARAARSVRWRVGRWGVSVRWVVVLWWGTGGEGCCVDGVEREGTVRVAMGPCKAERTAGIDLVV